MAAPSSAAPSSAGIGNALLVRSCFVCDSPHLAWRGIAHGYPVCRCEECGLTFLNPQPRDVDFSEFAAEDEPLQGHLAVRDAEIASTMRRATAKVQLDRLVAYVGPRRGRLLEIGCGSGEFMSLARARGFEVHGIDVSARACDRANRSLGGAFVRQGTVESLDLPEGDFDVCVCFDLIDHATDPVGILKRIRGLLRPSGVLFLRAPNLNSWPAKTLKEKWFESRSGQLFYFDIQTMQNALTKCGFADVEISPSHGHLSLDTIPEEVQRLGIPGLPKLFSALRSVAPSRLKTRPLQVVSSGMDVMCRSHAVREKPVVSIIVPVYNEVSTFPEMIGCLLDKKMSLYEKHIVIVESNSTDGTREEVEKCRHKPEVTVVYEDKPQGKGHAVRTGLTHATGDIILIQDADLEYDLDDYEQLLEPIRRHQCSFVLGSRHSGTWKIRQFTQRPVTALTMNMAHRVFTFLINQVCGSNLKDPFTMYKVFRRDCLRSLVFKANRFDFDWELVIKFLRKGYRPLEVPVNYRSRSFEEGKKITMVRDPITWLWALVRFGFGPLYEERTASSSPPEDAQDSSDDDRVPRSSFIRLAHQEAPRTENGGGSLSELAAASRAVRTAS